MASKDLAERLLLARKVARKVLTGMLTDQMGLLKSLQATSRATP